MLTSDSCLSFTEGGFCEDATHLILELVIGRLRKIGQDHRTGAASTVMSKRILTLILTFGSICIGQAQTGKITFFRPAGHWGRLAKITVYCDGKEIAKLSDRTKITVVISAEAHQCYDKKDASRETQPLVFTLGSNDERFVEVRWDSPSSLIDKVRPQLRLFENGWRPDPNNPDWREIRTLR